MLYVTSLWPAQLIGRLLLSLKAVRRSLRKTSARLSRGMVLLALWCHCKEMAVSLARGQSSSLPDMLLFTHDKTV
jgi:hypothetical protein